VLLPTWHAGITHGKMQMNAGPWLRKMHLYLGVFFSPLLLFFILTGWWQTVTDDQKAAKGAGFFHNLMSRLSTVHTDDYYPHGDAEHHSHLAMEVLIVSMVVALVLSILLGLWLAWTAPRGKGLAALAFLLGIALPVLILYLA
jgi:4-amino-4-deoxy-L-arabinose transferase-like glycosyltransferase